MESSHASQEESFVDLELDEHDEDESSGGNGGRATARERESPMAEDLPDGGEDVLRWIAGQKEEMVELLLKWCDTNSGSDNPTGLRRMADHLQAAYQSLHGHVSRIEFDRPQASQSQSFSFQGGPALNVRSVCRMGPRVLLSGHMDTVFGASHSFQRAKLSDDGRLIGPGAIDLKGGLIVMLYALRGFERSPWKSNLAWEILISPDEEVGSFASLSLLKEAARRNQLGLVYEPALEGGALASSRPGTGDFQAQAFGRSAHVGRDFPRGKNAIEALADFVGKVQSLNQLIPGAYFNVGNVSGGGPVNVVPDYARCEFNIRISELDQAGTIVSYLDEWVDKINQREGFMVSWEGHFDCPPKPMTPETEAALTMVREVAARQGLKITWQPTGGVCDGNHLANAGLTTVDSMGACGAGMHTLDEFVYIDSLVERAQLSALLLMELASGRMQLPWLRLLHG